MLSFWNIRNWFRTRDVSQYPLFWQDYLNRLEESTLNLKTLIADIPFVVFDTETTGLNHKEDQILSIGAVRVKDWKMEVADTLDFLVYQSYSPKMESVAIHGILPKAHDNSLEEAEAVRNFVAYIGDSVLVGHHVGFDLAMIHQALRPYGKLKLKNKILDTGNLARRAKGLKLEIENQNAYTLDQLCEDYHIPKNDRHTAAGDAFITGLLLQKLLVKLQNRGIRTLGDLLKNR